MTDTNAKPAVDNNQTAKKHQIGWITFMAISFVFSFLPVWKQLVLAWYRNEDYSHGFFVVPIVIYMLWRKRETLKRIPQDASLWGLMLMAVSLLVYYVGHVGQIVTLSFLYVITT
jgi:hypothetical protein